VYVVLYASDGQDIGLSSEPRSAGIRKCDRGELARGAPHPRASLMAQAMAAFKRGALAPLQHKQTQKALRLSEKSRGQRGEELVPAPSLPASGSPTSKGNRAETRA